MNTSYTVVWPTGNTYWYNQDHNYHRYYGPATPESWYLYGTWIKGDKMITQSW